MYLGDTDFEITKREVIVSVIFLLIMLIVGYQIAGYVRHRQDDRNAKYYQSIHVSDSTKFNYALKTNAGNTLAYGTVSAVGSVTQEGIGDYMTIDRHYEEYRMHTRLVCTGSGKNRSCHTQVYWTWDHIRTDYFGVSQVDFLGHRFLYSEFPKLPRPTHVGMHKISGHKRYVYYARPLSYTGTMYAYLDDRSLKGDKEFRDKLRLEDSVDEFVSKYDVPIFWIIFIVILLIIIAVFMYADNDWLNGC